MANKLKGILLLAIVAGVGYWYRAPILATVQRFEHRVLPCRTVLTYSIGDLDPRFGLSKSATAKDLADAEAIWEVPTQRDLFKYVETGGTVTVSLIYDYRQEATSKLSTINADIKSIQKSYDDLKSSYDALVRSYVARKAEFNKQVDYWNKQGGAPRDEYAKLQAEQKALNAMVDDVNSMAAQLNVLAQKLNLGVRNYNTIGKQTGEEFNEGEYVSDLTGQRIFIYQFDSRDKLVRVLAHELGHALGLEHVNDPKAIMYRLNQGSNGKLTEADLMALESLCK